VLGVLFEEDEGGNREDKGLSAQVFDIEEIGGWVFTKSDICVLPD